LKLGMTYRYDLTPRFTTALPDKVRRMEKVYR